jgi:hypothetical protein
MVKRRRRRTKRKVEGKKKYEREQTNKQQPACNNWRSLVHWVRDDAQNGEINKHQHVFCESMKGATTKCERDDDDNNNIIETKSKLAV